MIEIRWAGIWWPLSFIWRLVTAWCKRWAARQVHIAEYEAEREEAEPIKSSGPATVKETTRRSAQGKVGQSGSPLL